MNSPEPKTSAAPLPLELELDLQIACDAQDLPSQADFETWVRAALQAAGYTAQADTPPIEMCIRLVDAAESQALNHDYRGKDYPTNVLSFPLDMPDDIPEICLGDLVICAEVVTREAREQHKQALHHWAHLTLHGTLHLLGFDHIEPDQADIMEALETRILASFGIADPYAYPTNEHEANQIAS